MLGLSPFRKMTVLPDGRTCHPTKGFRGGYPHFAAPHVSPPRSETHPKDDVQLAVEAMTNWQRSRYHNARNRLGPSVGGSTLRELADLCLDIRRSDPESAHLALDHFVEARA